MAHKASKPRTRAVATSDLEGLLAARILAAAPVPLMLVNHGTEAAHLNPAFGTTFKGAESGVGKRVGELLGCVNAPQAPGCGVGPACAECPINDAIKQALSGASVHDRAVERACVANGRPGVRHLLVSAQPLELEGQNSAVVAIQDLTSLLLGVHQERDRLQVSLTSAERMASLGVLAAGVAHEINNPLAYVLANTSFAVEALRDRGAARDPKQLKEVLWALIDAVEGAQRVGRIVRDLRIFSRPEDDEVGPVNVEQVLEAALNLASSELRFRARLVLDVSGVPSVAANEQRLSQVFLNLLLNAAHAIPEGRPEDHEIRVATRFDPGGWVRVEVRDTGVGIPADTLTRIFDPFFTTKPVGVGTGLGLSICQSVVGHLGGKISVESSVGRGSTFTVHLPVAPALEPVAPGTTPLPLCRGRLLVVDDEPQVGKAVGRVLEAEHEVVVLTSARQALALVEGGERFDVILCDLMMPGMNGIELHAELGRINPALTRRMVFITGGAFTTAAREFLDQIPNVRLEKPFGAAALRQAVALQLGGSH